MSNVQIIEKDGVPEYAVVPIAEWERIRAAAEDADDVRAYDEAKAEMEGEETVPGEVVNRLLAGENPVRVWRELRGLQQQHLAERAGVTKGYLSHIENGRKEGTLSLYRALARELEVSLDDLVGSEEER